jgi:hypothetical protein
MNDMYHYVNPRTNQEAPLFEEVHKVIWKMLSFWIRILYITEILTTIISDLKP